MTKTTTKTKTQTKCLKNPTYAIFLKSWWLTQSKYDDRYLTLVILFTLVTQVTLFRSYNHFYRAECIAVSGFFFKTRCTNPTLLNVIWRVTCLQPAQMFFSTLDTSSLQYQHLFLPISIGGFWKYLSWTIWFQKIYLITIVKYLLEILILADTSKGSNL